MKYLSCNLVRKTILKKPTSFKYFKLSIKSWSMVFFGSDFYSLFCLKALHNEMKQKNISDMEVVVVNSNNPVYQYSVTNNFKIHLWPPNLDRSYDFGVVASFGKLIPKNIIEKFSLGILNVHASLLPKYRGGMPIVHAIKNGDTSTGITICRIKEDKFDIGEIILQKSCLIGENELMPSLHKRLAQLGSDCLLEVVNNLPKSLENSFPQSDKGVSYAPKLKKEDAVVRWDKMTALEIFNLHRALFGNTELTTTWREKPVKLVCLFLSSFDPFSLTNVEDAKSQPGSFIFNKKTKFLYIQCKDKPITVCTLKYRNKMYRAAAFQTGYLQNVERTFQKFVS